MPKQQRDRAVRMVLDHLDEYDSAYLACKAIGPKVGLGGGVAASLGPASVGRRR